MEVFAVFKNKHCISKTKWINALLFLPLDDWDDEGYSDMKIEDRL